MITSIKFQQADKPSIIMKPQRIYQARAIVHAGRPRYVFLHTDLSYNISQSQRSLSLQFTGPPTHAVGHLEWSFLINNLQPTHELIISMFCDRVASMVNIEGTYFKSPENICICKYRVKFYKLSAGTYSKMCLRVYRFKFQRLHCRVAR